MLYLGIGQLAIFSPWYSSADDKTKVLYDSSTTKQFSTRYLHVKHKTYFERPRDSRPLKILWKRKKMLETSVFLAFPQCFHSNQGQFSFV